MFVYPPIQRLLTPDEWHSYRVVGANTKPYAVMNSDDFKKSGVDFCDPTLWFLQMKNGDLVAGILLIIKPGASVGWTKLENVRDKDTFLNLLKDQKAEEAAFCCGLHVMWPHPHRDVESDKNFHAAVTTVINNAKDLAVKYNVDPEKQTIIVAWNVMNTRIMGVNLEDNRKRLMAALPTVHEWMVKVLHYNKRAKGCKSVIKVLEVLNHYKNKDSTALHLTARQYVYQVQKENLESLTPIVMDVHDGLAVIETGTEDFKHGKALCDNPDCPNPVGMQMTEKSVCGACKAAHYCSRQCQSNHWRTHKPLCPLMKEAKGAVKGWDKPELSGLEL